MQRAIFQIESTGDSVEFAGQLAGLLAPGDVVGLCGDLGAGKTFLAGAIAHGLGVPNEIPITSPTFTLIKEYSGRLPIYHMDLYRLGHPSELYDLGLWEYYEGEGVCLVEWCDRFDDLWPEQALIVTIDLGDGESRKITATGEGRGGEICSKLARSWLKISAE
jgi:tRNA threonylcarbamoyladenosine biosynthesis protein TsaE